MSCSTRRSRSGLKRAAGEGGAPLNPQFDATADGKQFVILDRPEAEHPLSITWFITGSRSFAATAAAAVNPEIGQIRRNHRVPRVQFAQTNQAKVRQAGLPVLRQPNRNCITHLLQT